MIMPPVTPRWGDRDSDMYMWGYHCGYQGNRKPHPYLMADFMWKMGYDDGKGDREDGK